MTLPLSGIRVLDFGRFIAGPYCAALLADFGADVIRIDRREGSEDRYLGPITADGFGAAYLSLNRNKRNLTLDPSRPEAREVLTRLVQTADVVVANLPLEVLEKMGLGYEALRALKPDIILARISTFGPDGPYAHRVGFDTIAQAMSGAMAMTGFAPVPVRSAVPFEDYGTALHTAFGVLAALLHRAKTGEGQIVDGSLLATGVTLMQALIAERHVTGIQRQQIGNAGQYAAPYDTYPAKDGWITIAVNGHPMFTRWARAVGRPELADDPRFADDALRAEHRAELDAVMRDWLASRTTAEAVAALEAARVPAGPVLQLHEVLEDPQVKARRLLEHVPFPGAPQDVPLANTAVRLSATPGGIRDRAPLLGEHTDAILAELGFSAPEIAALRAARAV